MSKERPNGGSDPLARFVFSPFCCSPALPELKPSPTPLPPEIVFTAAFKRAVQCSHLRIGLQLCYDLPPVPYNGARDDGAF
jgi:hypothetical protein